VALLLLGVAPLASADAPPARQLLDEAIELFNRGSVDESVQLLERARRATREPKLLGQIELYLGLNHAAERRTARARQAFAEALGHDPSLRLDAYRTKPELVALFEAVRRERLALLRVMANVAGAEVWLDGGRAGRVPLEATLAPGGHTLELRGADGARLYQRRVELVAGRATLIEVMLAPSGTGKVEPTTPSPTPERPRPPPRARPRRLWTWVALGGAVAASAVAIGLGASARADHDDACALLVDASPSCEARTALRRPADAARYRELYDAVGAKSLGANVSWGIAGGLAVTAIVLYFVEGRAPAAERALRASLAPGPGGSLGLSFALQR